MAISFGRLPVGFHRNENPRSRPAGSPQGASTSDLITRLREAVIPAALHGSEAERAGRRPDRAGRRRRPYIRGT